LDEKVRKAMAGAEGGGVMAEFMSLDEFASGAKALELARFTRELAEARGFIRDALTLNRGFGLSARVAQISGATLWRWLSQDALRPKSLTYRGVWRLR
jgi:hypothetical protein